jgi:hypothetical protein
VDGCESDVLNVETELMSTILWNKVSNYDIILGLRVGTLAYEYRNIGHFIWFRQNNYLNI